MLDFNLPSSKSEINRLFIIAFLSHKPFLIRNFNFCEDTLVLYNFFKQINCNIQHTDKGLLIDSSKYQLPKSLTEVYVNKAGTALRFLLPLLSFLDGEFIIYGEASLAKRPILSLVQTLNKIHPFIELPPNGNSLPLRIHGSSKYIPNKFDFEDGLPSSQFITSILLLAPILPIGCKVFFDKTSLNSISYVEMTINMLRRLGVEWIEHEGCYELVDNTIKTFEYEVSADWTSASYFIAHAAIVRKDCYFPNLLLSSFQPDVEQLAFWLDLNLSFQEHENGLSVHPYDFSLWSFNFDFFNVPDLFQTFAVLTAFKEGIYHFSGLQSLPFKETHRLHAMQTELRKIGLQLTYNQVDGTATITNEGLFFPSICEFQTYHDHRMALSLSLLYHLNPDIAFDNPKVVDKSFPNFWIELKKIMPLLKLP